MLHSPLAVSFKEIIPGSFCPLRRVIATRRLLPLCFVVSIFNDKSSLFNVAINDVDNKSLAELGLLGRLIPI